MCGYALAKFKFPGRDALFNVMLGGVLFPATALALPLFLLFSDRARQHLLRGVLPSSSARSGSTSCRIFAAAAVPDELLESARIDGAGEFRIFFGGAPADVAVAGDDLPVPVRRYLE